MCSSALFKDVEQEKKKKDLQKGFWKCEKMFEDVSFLLEQQTLEVIKCFKKDLI